MPRRTSLGRGLAGDGLYWWGRRNRWRRAALDALHFDGIYRRWLWQVWEFNRERHA